MKTLFLEKNHTPAAHDRHVLVLGVDGQKVLLPLAKEWDTKLDGFLTHVLAHTDSKNTLDEPMAVMAPQNDHGISHVVLVKCEDKCGTLAVELGGKIAACVNPLRKDNVCIALDTLNKDHGHVFHTLLAFGYHLRTWTFDKYFTKGDRKQCNPHALSILVHDPKQTTEAFVEYHNLFESITLTRTLVSEPGNVIYPESFASIAKNLEAHGIEVDVLDKHQLKQMGMHALLGVAQGSEHEARLVVMQWKGGKQGDAPLVFVGKGVTFDSGGISIKPSNRMEEMKGDMAGAAAVTGLLSAVARNNVAVNVVGILGLVENMPSGTAQRPGDIVSSLSGQTIEVINTDAEGRLVLADALWYAQDRFKPKYMIDLATLTGAIVVALGHRYAGLFSNDPILTEGLQQASARTGEKLWHLPLDKDWVKALKSDYADLKNSDYGVGAGSCLAAQFLECFVNQTKWAHLDIAGVEWSSKSTATCQKGATGFGVHLLYQFVKDESVVDKK